MTQTDWAYCKSKSSWPTKWEVIYREKDIDGGESDKQWKFHAYCMTENSARKTAQREARRSKVRIVSVNCDDPYCGTDIIEP